MDFPQLDSQIATNRRPLLCTSYAQDTCREHLELLCKGGVEHAIRQPWAQLLRGLAKLSYWGRSMGLGRKYGQMERHIHNVWRRQEEPWSPADLCCFLFYVDASPWSSSNILMIHFLV